MSQFDASKDYYAILGADENSSPRDIERLYKRLARKRHPDRGGTDDEMKVLNEAYRCCANIRRENHMMPSGEGQWRPGRRFGQPRRLVT